ncbi:hypothetical protein SNEBB_003001 [Seison nebaliae]|nr:hypothetical protein SNEBB_003001 [Seison nebaliae]
MFGIKFITLLFLFITAIAYSRADNCDKYADMLPKCSQCTCGETIDDISCVPKCAPIQCPPGQKKYKKDECCEGCRKA